ncbi:MAG: hypothetical protein WCJ26_09105 [bacterium]
MAELRSNLADLARVLAILEREWVVIYSNIYRFNSKTARILQLD